MASIPSLAVSAATAVTAAGADPRKPPPSSLAVDKSNAYQRSPQAPENGGLGVPLRALDAAEAMSMLREGKTVQTAMYVPLLARCVEARSLGDAQALHGHIVKTGTGEERFVGTCLVRAYMKCGTPAVARKLFDKLPEKNVVTWTGLIAGYNDNSQPELGLEVFVEMLELGSYPTHYTLSAVLSSCCALYDIELGEQVHGYTVKYGTESNTSTGNSLCGLYSKCRRSDSAMKAFQRIQDKDVISWTVMISACAEDGNTELGLSLFNDMLLEGAMPNQFTWTSVLSLCSASSHLGLGKQVHGFCIKLGHESSNLVKVALIYLYLRGGESSKAMRLFEDAEDVSIFTWNAMILGHSQLMNLANDYLVARSIGFQALKIFRDLTRSGTKPDLFSFSNVLSVCSAMMALEQGEQIHAQTIKTGLLDVIVNTALVNMYIKCGCIEDATKAFVEMPTRTPVSWTSMLTGYSQHGRSREAIQLFEDMRSAGVRPNEVTFVGVLSACSHAFLVEEAKYYFDMMKNEYKIEPVINHYVCMVNMFVRLGRLEDAFAFVERTGFKGSETIWSILVAGCRSHGNMELAFYAAGRLLELRPKGIETYILLMNMYISAQRWDDVSRVRKVMKEENVGFLRDRSWISIRDKVHFFRANDRSHPQATEIYQMLDNLLEKAKALGYEPYQNVELSEGEEEQKAAGSVKHHSERLAVALGLINTPHNVTVRVVKNITMCRDCHSSIKFFSLLANREIVVRDSKQLHKFKEGQCSCGDFSALL